MSYKEMTIEELDKVLARWEYQMEQDRISLATAYEFRQAIKEEIARRIAAERAK
jgi:DNA-binding FadR family transcriptional regulator